MQHQFMRRLVYISFFIGLNIVLGSYFLSQFNYPLPSYATQFLSRFNLISKNYSSVENLTIAKPTPDLSDEGLLVSVNDVRQQNNVPDLIEQDILSEAAKTLLSAYREVNYDVDAVDKQLLERTLKQTGYNYAWVGNNILVGPLFNEEVARAISSDPEQLKTLLNPAFTQVGIATSIEEVNGAQVGVVIQLLAEPQKKTTMTSTQKPVKVTPPPQQTVRDLPDEEVITALNSYRQTHGVAPLSLNDNLCRYAEKRASDLRAFGGLDGHAGFREDFQDPKNPPVGIKEYSGTYIGENLAHQSCKNMTTGESFIADTGTALIEWCFDSSTKGHREAQLSTEFKNVCVRHKENMYVVIFGN